MPSPLYHGTASLYIHEQKGDFPQRKVQAGSTSVPVLSPCSNAQVAGSTVDISSSSAASPAQLTWAHLLQPGHCTATFLWSPLLCSASICFIFYSFPFFLWKLFQKQKCLQASHNQHFSSWRSFPQEHKKGLPSPDNLLSSSIIFSSHQCSTSQYSTKCHQGQFWNRISILHQFSGIISMVNNLPLQVREGMRSTENHFPWKHPAHQLLHVLHGQGKLSSPSESQSSFLRTLKTSVSEKHGQHAADSTQAEKMKHQIENNLVKTTSANESDIFTWREGAQKPN